MAVTSAEVDALRSAYYAGILTVRRPDGGQITYQSMADMWTALQRAEEELSGTARDRYSRATYSRD